MNENQNDARTQTPAICAASVAWLVLAKVLPAYQMWAVLLTFFVVVFTYFMVKHITEK